MAKVKNSRKRHKARTADEAILADKQIRAVSIPYDYDTKEYPIEVLLQKFRPVGEKRAGLYVPEYQRDFVWNEQERSRFIESVLLGVPIQPIFAADDDTGRLEIIDGSQRVRTLDQFESDGLTLSGLEKIDSLNGFRFSDLTEARQSKFRLIDIRFHVITDKADFSTRADIFDRINTHGKALTRSEIRKGAFAGTFYDFIIKSAQNPLFIELCPITKERGEAEELVLRFFAYSERYLEFKHDVFKFLDTYIKQMNESGFDENAYTVRFEKMLEFVQKNFPFGFRKKAGDRSTPRVRFEALAVGSYLAIEVEPQLTVSNVNWLSSNEFKTLTTSDASNNQGKLRGRIEFVRDCLLGVIDPQTLSYAGN